MDRVLLMCFNYNPVEGKYSLAVLNVVRLGGILTLSLIGLFWLKQRFSPQRHRDTEKTTRGEEAVQNAN
jgi:protein SCO1/2